MIISSEVSYLSKAYSEDDLIQALACRRCLLLLPAILADEYAIRHALPRKFAFPDFFVFSVKKIKALFNDYFRDCKFPFYELADIFFGFAYIGGSANFEILRGIFEKYYGIEFNEKIVEELKGYEIPIAKA